MSSAVVSVVKCGEYRLFELKEKIREAVKLAGAPHVKGKKVLLKPNILSGAAPKKAVTTHPEFVKAAITVFQEMGAEVLVGDSPGFQNPDTAGKKSGIRQVTEETGAVWADFTRETEVMNPEGKLVKRFRVAEVFNEADLIVSLPKLKTHSLMYYTGAMKNLFGMVVGLKKGQYHVRFPDRENFAAMLVDLNVLLKPGFALMDGIVGMEGPGPGSGTPRKAGVILASKNILALDMAACRIIGYEPVQIPVIREALMRKIWLESPVELEIKGESLESVRIPDYDLIRVVKDVGFLKRYLPGFVYKFVENVMVARPFFDNEKCIRCGECVGICPVDALELKPEGIEIEREKCIRCYCCHEICPVDAIELKRF